MLSIGKLVAGQARYYSQQVADGRDDYYSGRGEAPGHWVGAGAGALGLRGVASAESFDALLAGVDPSDPRLERSLRSTPRPAGAVAGFDLTFSAPKSVSVLFAIGDQATAAALVAAHEAAVQEAIRYLEDAAVRVRRGRDGVRVERAGGLVAVAYRHRMSRALDPQLHTHVVCANAAQGPDGRWTALHGQLLYEHARTAGYLYQAQLRSEVRERLGLEWGSVVKGAAELSAVPPAVLAEFSRRRAEILEAADEAGGERSLAQRSVLAVATRERKRYGIDTHTWQEEIRARAAEHGLDRDAVAHALTPTLAPRAMPVGLGDRLASADGLTHKVNVFSERDVLRAYAEAAGQGATVEELRKHARAFCDRTDVLSVDGGGFTTAELVACEARLVRSAVDRAHEGCAVIDGASVDAQMARQMRTPTAEQARAVRDIAGSGNGVDVIEALAGTGKTYVAGLLREVYERAGYSVIGVAPTGRAVRELVEQAGMRAQTLDRALIEIDRNGLRAGCVLVLDEAGMAATRPVERLLAAATAAGAKVIAIGDSGQLPSVRAGGWLRAVAERVGARQLTDVMRQRDPRERRALAALHDGRPETYIGWALQRDRIIVHLGDVHAAALEDWRAAVERHGVRNAVLIARDNRTRGQLNRAAREQWRASGALDRDAAYGSVAVAVGDRVVCRRNDRGIDVDNGTRGAVLATRRDRIVLETDGGAIRELPAEYVAAHVEHAYCLTGHGMQGATVEHATVVARPRDLTRGWSYTALSRARGQTRLHIAVDDVAVINTERSELAPADERPPPGRADVLAEVESRMRVRDDEDLASEHLTRGDPSAVEEPAARAEPPVPAGATRGLRDLHAEIRGIDAQLAALPRADLSILADREAQHATLLEQRAACEQALASLPPRRCQLPWRGRDPHDASRRQLAERLAQLDRQLAAQTARISDLRTRLGGARERYKLLHRERAVLRDEATALSAELAERTVLDPPAWARDLLGVPPTAPRQRAAYDRGVRAVARYRLDRDLADDTPGLGPEPRDREGRLRHLIATREVERAQLRLGRAPDRDRSLGLELDR